MQSHKWLPRVAWSLRITAVLVLLVTLATIIGAGWPHSLQTCGRLSGFFQAAMLFVISFLYVTNGKTKIIVSVTTIALGLGVMVFATGMLILPHL
jgi:hypothetical protein